MNDVEFIAFMDLLMCSDPWPTLRAGDNLLMVNLADKEAVKRGFDGWITALHEFKPSNTSQENTMHPSTKHIMQFFKYEHLREDLKAVSKPFCILAETMVNDLPENPELTAGLRDLLRAKDCAVRAKLAG